MESILSGILGVVVYIDDVLVTGKSEQEHLSVLEEVLCRIVAYYSRFPPNLSSELAPLYKLLKHNEPKALRTARYSVDSRLINARFVSYKDQALALNGLMSTRMST